MTVTFRMPPVFGLLLAGYLFCSSVALAQPIIDDVNVTEASKDLRRLLYQRYELREEISEVDSSITRLRAREKSLTAMIELQSQLDELQRRIDKAKDLGDEQLFKTLEQQAIQLELEIEFRQVIGDLEDEIAEVTPRIALLERLNQEDLAEPVVAFVKDLHKLCEIHRELHSLQAAGLELDALKSEEKALEEHLGVVEEAADSGREYVELLDQLREAYEEEAEERIKDVRDELERLRVSKDTPAVAPKPTVLDPLQQPVPITQEGLQRVADDDFYVDIVPLLKTHCYECHSNDTQSGELNLEQMVTQRPIVVNRDKWINVLEQAKNRVMPPEDEDQPSEGDRSRMVLTLHKSIHEFDYSNIHNPGYESARRLTHDEYDHTIRDLFGVDLRPTKKFPVDLVGSSGFDNSANSLFVQPLLMERYMNAADLVVTTALPPHPVTDTEKATRQLIFFQTPGDGVSEVEAANAVLKRFLTRAYRRPPTGEELERGVRQYSESRDHGLSFHEAVKVVLSTTLTSPYFLLKSEELRDPSAPFMVDDWELASRLSYFLWASMPDAELFQLASSNRLHEPNVLHAQVERMIADDRSSTLGSIFAAQWLGSRHLGTRVRMDPIDNPWCTDSLMTAMRDETAMFFQSLVRDNLPIPKLIDADFTFLNEELAKFYKIRGVAGDEMQRISLEGSERGGIFGQGSLLAVTSFPYRTSPVVRGKWILGDVLGTPPPPPPPNVSELPEEIEENDKLTFREKLELHRRSPNCYACHSQMDPLGFSLEGYDFFGRERKSGRSRRRKVDVSGHLPNGTVFVGLPGLKQVVIEQRLDDLCKQVTRKMLSYALGRQLEYFDEPAVRKIVTAAEQDEYRLQALIHEIVNSYPFRYKQKQHESL